MSDKKEVLINEKVEAGKQQILKLLKGDNNNNSKTSNEELDKILKQIIFDSDRRNMELNVAIVEVKASTKRVKFGKLVIGIPEDLAQDLMKNMMCHSITKIPMKQNNKGLKLVWLDTDVEEQESKKVSDE